MSLSSYINLIIIFFKEPGLFLHLGVSYNCKLDLQWTLTGQDKKFSDLTCFMYSTPKMIKKSQYNLVQSSTRCRVAILLVYGQNREYNIGQGLSTRVKF